MKCPKCAAALEPVRVGTTEVDRCAACRGLWFDARELERLLATPGAEDVDDGDARVGRRHDAQERVRCPRCGVPMVRMAHVEQGHIWYETCGTCGGSWFDAGEFRDLATYDAFDVIRGWFVRARR